MLRSRWKCLNQAKRWRIEYLGMFGLSFTVKWENKSLILFVFREVECSDQVHTHVQVVIGTFQMFSIVCTKMMLYLSLVPQHFAWLKHQENYKPSICANYRPSICVAHVSESQFSC